MNKEINLVRDIKKKQKQLSLLTESFKRPEIKQIQQVYTHARNRSIAKQNRSIKFKMLYTTDLKSRQKMVNIKNTHKQIDKDDPMPP